MANMAKTSQEVADDFQKKTSTDGLDSIRLAEQQKLEAMEIQQLRLNGGAFSSGNPLRNIWKMDKNRKTSAEALFRSDGEDEIQLQKIIKESQSAPLSQAKQANPMIESSKNNSLTTQ